MKSLVQSLRALLRLYLALFVAREVGGVAAVGVAGAGEEFAALAELLVLHDLPHGFPGVPAVHGHGHALAQGQATSRAMSVESR